MGEEPLAAYLNASAGYSSSWANAMSGDTAATLASLAGEADYKRRSEQNAAATSGDGAGGGGAILIAFAPPLALPAYAMYLTWTFLSGRNIHLLFVILAEICELMVFVYAIWALYQFVPRFVGSMIAAVYFAACYGLAAYWMKIPDYWPLVIGGATGVGGYFLGRFTHKVVAQNRLGVRMFVHGWISALIGTSGVVGAIAYFAFAVGAGAWMGWILLDRRGLCCRGDRRQCACNKVACACTHLDDHRRRWRRAGYLFH